MSWANYLTFMRVLISPIFLIVYLQYDNLGISWMALPYILVGLLALSELSDALDGFIARKYNQVTDFGKILDPMADSIARVSVFLTFTQPPVSLPLLLVFVFLYRDSVISTLRIICALKGFALAARPSGKIKAVLQAATIFLILSFFISYVHGQISLRFFQTASLWTVALVAFYTLASGVDYLYANRDYIRKIVRRKKEENPV